MLDVGGSATPELCDPFGDRRLLGRVAIVTGDGRGIGQAIALAFGAAGAEVVLVSRTPPEIEETAETLRARFNRRALPISADVTDERLVQRVVARVVREFGGVDVLVNNAGELGRTGRVHRR